jgi:biotin synthase-like enzyme
MCFVAGANSIFYGEKLLTTGNPDVEADQQLLRDAGLRPAPPGGHRNGNPERVPIPSRDGAPPAKPAGSPRD